MLSKIRMCSDKDLYHSRFKAQIRTLYFSKYRIRYHALPTSIPSYCIDDAGF